MIVFDPRFFDLYPELRSLTIKDQKIWDGLNERQRQVTALTCLGYTNNEMVRVLGIGSTSIKYHLDRVYRAFKVMSKAQLRGRLSTWDWSEWAKNYPRT